MADSEEVVIRRYFHEGYNYKTILNFLEKFHGIFISKRTLLNRLKKYGLKRRNIVVDENEVRAYIQRELQGPGQLLGYRAMWKRLILKYGKRIPRHSVQVLLKELDPEGSNARKKHVLKRRAYLNPGPNYCWHVDGYDKLKPYGFPIHGCIDGFSRRIMWLEVRKSNNDPRVIGHLFLDCIKEVGCPTLVRSDRGTENLLMAATQSYFHNDGNYHRYGSSHGNQRIESWWTMLRRSWSAWWINFYKDMVSAGQLDTSNQLQMECLWFSFKELMQRELDELKESWNTHYIRSSRYHTIPGIPNAIFYLPESVGARDHSHQIAESKIQEVTVEIGNPLVDEQHELYQEYFAETSSRLGLQKPQLWQDALHQYEQLLDVANS